MRFPDPGGIIIAQAEPLLASDIGPQEAEEFLLKRLQDERCFVRVVEFNGGEIAGCTVSEIQERPASLFSHQQSVLYLAQIVVAPQQGKRGVGRHLIEDLFAVANAHAITRVELNVWEFEGNAQQFFLRNGFRDFGYRIAHNVAGSR
ncbi:MAG: GNAT family N-acetyltransferase [Spirochaetaceae bacterium]|nr:MAG: GNAT family N-acetyltransferase [Spirochaetaceae bacterium]